MVTTATERQCPVWTVNDMARVVRLTQGTRLGTVTAVERIYASAGTPSEAAGDPFESSDPLEDSLEEDDFVWEEDNLDQTHELFDFGYEDDTASTHWELPPSQALAAVASVDVRADQGLQDEPTINLEHLEQSQRQELHKLTDSFIN